MAQSNTTISPISGVRETSVQQAVTFLSDPRVTTSNRQAAVSFLRNKGVTDAELFEAHRRVGLPYPPHAERTGPSWISIMLGMTAAAGVWSVARELLRKHVVPLYFPEVEERNEREERKEREMEEMRKAIHELVERTRKTEEMVEKLSRDLNERDSLENRESGSVTRDLSVGILNDFNEGVSESVSESGGTLVSGAIGTGSRSGKDGSLAYGVGESSGMVRNRVQGWEEGKREGGESDEDEFMKIRPAEVWELSCGEGKDEKNRSKKLELFRRDILNESSRMLGDGSGQVGSVDERDLMQTPLGDDESGMKRKDRPTSMPSLEGPLSDEE